MNKENGVKVSERVRDQTKCERKKEKDLSGNKETKKGEKKTKAERK